MYRRIRDFREDRDLLQKQVAQMLACPKPAIPNTKPEKTISLLLFYSSWQIFTKPPRIICWAEPTRNNPCTIAVKR